MARSHGSIFDHRLRKLEGARGMADGPWFFVFGRTKAEIAAAIDRLAAKPDRVEPVLWTSPDDVPGARWATARDLNDVEILAVLETNVGPMDAWPEPDPGVRHRTAAQLDDALLAAVLAGGPKAYLDG
jgi:hypothetical protein